MSLGVSKIHPVGRAVVKRSPTLPQTAAGSGEENAARPQAYGALVAPAAAPRRDDRSRSLDYANAPFVAQLIASRDAASPSHLSRRFQADDAASAYRHADSLADTLPTGLYARRAV
ncbi:MAG: hypothetical protein AAGL24_21685 [Pseudomonadota bacterium]